MSANLPTVHRESLVAAISARDRDALEPAFRAWAIEVGAGTLRERLNRHYEISGVEVVPGRSLSHETAARLLAGLAKIEAPAATTEIVKAVTRCLAVTASRERAAADVAVLIATFTEDLAGYPADAVVSAFRDWRRAERFWPTVAEITALCDRAAGWRRSLRALCERTLAAAPAAIEDGRPTRYADLPAEEKAKLDALLAKTYAALDATAAARSKPAQSQQPKPQPDEAEQWQA